jgi:hypothetical protein
VITLNKAYKLYKISPRKSITKQIVIQQLPATTKTEEERGHLIKRDATLYNLNYFSIKNYETCKESRKYCPYKEGKQTKLSIRRT